MSENDNGEQEQQNGSQPPEPNETLSLGPQETGSAETSPQEQQPWGYTPPPGQQPGYGSYGPQPGYGQPGYGPPPGYGHYGPPPGYGHYGPPPGYGQPWGYGGYGVPPQPQGSRAGKVLAYVAVAVLAAGAGAGAALGLSNGGTSASNNSALGPSIGGGFGGSGSGGFGGSGTGGLGGGTGGGTGPQPSLNVHALQAKVDPAVVDVTSQLKYNQATAEGTGMVVSPDGYVLTNNHVIDQATSITATQVQTGKTFTAKVVGYDSTDDVAVLKLVNASGLKAVSMGDSSKLKVGDGVLALGNAGGKGGLPSTAEGVIEGTGRTIQASDSGAGSTETLHNMLQTNAPIQEGDSGGPLVNAAGQVIGMDTAANSSSGSGGGSGSGGSSGGSSGSQLPSMGTEGFAIPINQATAIARTIEAGKAGGNVHIGLAGFMGISVGDAGKPCPGGTNGKAGTNSGAEICTVFPDTPVANSGLHEGDVITSVNGHGVTGANSLTGLMAGTHPGDKISVVYVDSKGGKHTTEFPLAEWAK